jgi:hypothetical protein
MYRLPSGPNSISIGLSATTPGRKCSTPTRLPLPSVRIMNSLSRVNSPNTTESW